MIQQSLHQYIFVAFTQFNFFDKIHVHINLYSESESLSFSEVEIVFCLRRLRADHLPTPRRN